MRFAWTVLWLLAALRSEGLGNPADGVRCGTCHTDQSRHSETSPMVGTLLPPTSWKRGVQKGRADGYEYRLWPATDGHLWYETHSEAESIRVPVVWIFGSGRTGQTFILNVEGELRESRVSFYPRLKGLGLTIGAANSAPASLRDAAGRLMSKSDVRDCFGCHSSSISGSKGGEPPSLTPGLRCERCHGDGTTHIAKPVRGTIASLRAASTEEITELCGVCHRTWEQVMLMKLKGVNTVRFQPFRLSQSRCYSPSDRRIACTACHDPHEPSTMQVQRVDAVCLSCHAKPPHSTKDCASCHMPKVELPGAHAAFSDHRIRTARPGEPFPD